MVNQQPLTTLGESVMSTHQKEYTAFMESVCKQFKCMDALPALKEGFSALCETIQNENSRLFGESMRDEDLSLAKLGKICKYTETQDGTPVIYVMRKNVPLSELSKYKTEMDIAAGKFPLSKIKTSDIKKYTMISPEHEITDTDVQYVDYISFDTYGTGNVYGFKMACWGEQYMCFWMPNDMSHSEYDDAAKYG